MHQRQAPWQNSMWLLHHVPRLTSAHCNPGSRTTAHLPPHNAHNTLSGPPAHPVALVLRFVAVDGQRGPAVHAQLARHRVAPLLGLAEDEDAAAVHLLRRRWAGRVGKGSSGQSNETHEGLLVRTRAPDSRQTGHHHTGSGSPQTTTCKQPLVDHTSGPHLLQDADHLSAYQHLPTHTTFSQPANDAARRTFSRPACLCLCNPIQPNLTFSKPRRTFSRMRTSLWYFSCSAGKSKIWVMRWLAFRSGLPISTW